jgi:hypothetical protein
VVVSDPRSGEIHGHRQLRRFVNQNKAWLGERRARNTSIPRSWMPTRSPPHPQP